MIFGNTTRSDGENIYLGDDIYYNGSNSNRNGDSDLIKRSTMRNMIVVQDQSDTSRVHQSERMLNITKYAFVGLLCGQVLFIIIAVALSHPLVDVEINQWIAEEKDQSTKEVLEKGRALTKTITTALMGSSLFFVVFALVGSMCESFCMCLTYGIITFFINMLYFLKLQPIPLVLFIWSFTETVLSFYLAILVKRRDRFYHQMRQESRLVKYEVPMQPLSGSHHSAHPSHTSGGLSGTPLHMTYMGGPVATSFPANAGPSPFTVAANHSPAIGQPVVGMPGVVGVGGLAGPHPPSSLSSPVSRSYPATQSPFIT